MKILITGPCCSGKTTTLNEIESLGYNVTKEIGVGNLMKQGLKGDELELAILKKRIKIWNSVKNEKLIFFDRSFLDLVIYRKFDKKPVLKSFVDAVKKYRFDKVFILEPLDKFEHDGVRELFIKDSEDAERWFKIAVKTCKEYGYNPIVVKNMSVKDRIDFIFKKLRLA